MVLTGGEGAAPPGTAVPLGLGTRLLPALGSLGGRARAMGQGGLQGPVPSLHTSRGPQGLAPAERGAGVPGAARWRLPHPPPTRSGSRGQCCPASGMCPWCHLLGGDTARLVSNSPGLGGSSVEGPCLA